MFVLYFHRNGHKKIEFVVFWMRYVVIIGSLLESLTENWFCRFRFPPQIRVNKTHYVISSFGLSNTLFLFRFFFFSFNFPLPI
jgi:hypothetical protein